MAEIHTYSSEQTWKEAIVTSIHSRMLKKNQEGRVFRLAVSGGSTPGPIYQALAQYSDINWSLVEIFLVDERYVTHEDENSNHRLITETLISKLPEKPAQWFSYDTSLPIGDCVKDYEKRFENHDKPFFDLILLGLGSDGHTASLFPHIKALEEKKHWVAHTITTENIIKDRLTLTYPALESTGEIFFLIKGPAKRNILEQASKSKPNSAKIPAARLLHHDGAQVFFGEY